MTNSTTSTKTRSRKAVPHVVPVDGGLGCKNCGEFQGVHFPVRVDVYAAAMKAFERAHRPCRFLMPAGKARYEFSTPSEWARSWDKGTSSKTIFLVLEGRSIFGPNEAADVPRDPDDFGRCLRLVEKIKGWRERLHRVAERYPAWLPFVERWDELAALYREEFPSGSAPKLYHLIAELQGNPPTETMPVLSAPPAPSGAATPAPVEKPSGKAKGKAKPVEPAP